MPLHVFQCNKCGVREEYHFRTCDEVPPTITCDYCGGLSLKVFSPFNTSASLFKKLSGVDDTDDLTLGKIVADKKIPDEFKRPMREKQEKFNRNKAEYEKRKALHHFSETDD